jgi:hypothetical protein
VLTLCRQLHAHADARATYARCCASALAIAIADHGAMRRAALLLVVALAVTACTGSVSSSNSPPSIAAPPPTQQSSVPGSNGSFRVECYWAPTLVAPNGTYVEPERSTFYYRNRPYDYGTTIPFRPDFRMVAVGTDPDLCPASHPIKVPQLDFRVL